MRTPLTLLVPLLLAHPFQAGALPPPIGLALETSVSSGPRGADARLVAVTSCWLEGDVEAEARLGFESVDRPGGRGVDAVTPALGLRWGPDAGRWRPRLGVEVGVRLPVAGLPAAPTGATRAGVELFARRDLSLSVGLGWRWTSGVGQGIEAAVGLGSYW